GVSRPRAASGDDQRFPAAAVQHGRLRDERQVQGLRERHPADHGHVQRGRQADHQRLGEWQGVRVEHRRRCRNVPVHAPRSRRRRRRRRPHP
ncbi:unnamed protein product, partial [Ectocarpus fasciculatus]